MTQPLNAADQYVDSMMHGDLYTVYERADGTAYKIVVSRYTGEKTIVEYANAQAYRSWRRGDDIMLDPEGKGHKGVVSDGGSLRDAVATRMMGSCFARKAQAPQ